MNTTSISFTIEVKDITQKEADELLNEVAERQDIHPKGQTDIDDFEFILEYNGQIYGFHYSQANSVLTTSVPFWEANQRER